MGQNRYSLVTVGVNRREAARIFEINRYDALREGGFRIFKLSVTVTIDGILTFGGFGPQHTKSRSQT